MFWNILLTFANKIATSCNKDWSDSSSFDSDCSHIFNVGRCYSGDYSRNFKSKESIKQLAYLAPFICTDNMPSYRNFLPHIEFANIADFYATMPDNKEISELFKSNSISCLVKLASKVEKFEHYDAYNALFYNADALGGLCKREFDSNYILWFLARFYYFLELFNCKNPCIMRENVLLAPDQETIVDLLNLPSEWHNVNFGCQENALRLFNSIISDTIVNPYLVKFILILIKQLETVEITKTGKKIKDHIDSSRFTTFTAYYMLLRGSLMRTMDVSSLNLKIKFEFLSKNKVFAFVEVPIEVDPYRSDDSNIVIVTVVVSNNAPVPVSNSVRDVASKDDIARDLAIQYFNIIKPQYINDPAPIGDQLIALFQRFVDDPSFEYPCFLSELDGMLVADRIYVPIFPDNVRNQLNDVLILLVTVKEPDDIIPVVPIIPVLPIKKVVKIPYDSFFPDLSNSRKGESAIVTIEGLARFE
jgi:hypothetical protein